MSGGALKLIGIEVAAIGGHLEVALLERAGHDCAQGKLGIGGGDRDGVVTGVAEGLVGGEDVLALVGKGVGEKRVGADSAIVVLGDDGIVMETVICCPTCPAKLYSS